MQSAHPRIFELELWCKPGQPGPLDGKLVAQDCRNATSLSEVVVIGLNYFPDQTDTTNLAWLLARDESRKADFERYCTEQEIESNQANEASACRYLAYSNGQALAWLHFPEGAAGLSMAYKVLEWADKQGFVVLNTENDVRFDDKDSLAIAWPP